MKTVIKVKNHKHEAIVNNKPRTFTDADFPVGTVSHQGDVIFVRINQLPVSAKIRKDRQLAIGNTQGSRHILKKGNAFDCSPTVLAKEIANVCRNISINNKYIGPVFKTSKGKASVIHPEHGHQHFKGDMTIACVYQRNLDAEEHEQRTQD